MQTSIAWLSDHNFTSQSKSRGKCSCTHWISKLASLVYHLNNMQNPQRDEVLLDRNSKSWFEVWGSVGVLVVSPEALQQTERCFNYTVCRLCTIVIFYRFHSFQFSPQCIVDNSILCQRSKLHLSNYCYLFCIYCSYCLYFILHVYLGYYFFFYCCFLFWLSPCCCITQQMC